jgi:hypothetical protein
VLTAIEAQLKARGGGNFCSPVLSTDEIKAYKNKSTAQRQAEHLSQVTIADILIYHELSYVVASLKQQIDRFKHPNTFTWFERTAKDHEIIEQDQRLRNLISQS